MCGVEQLTSLQLLCILVHVVRCDEAQELDIVFRMKLCHLLLCCVAWAKYFHLFVQAIVEQQIVSHPDAVRLHWMASSIVIIPHVPCVVKVMED